MGRKGQSQREVLAWAVITEHKHSGPEQGPAEVSKCGKGYSQRMLELTGPSRSSDLTPLIKSTNTITIG